MDHNSNIFNFSLSVGTFIDLVITFSAASTPATLDSPSPVLVFLRFGCWLVLGYVRSGASGVGLL